MKSDILNVIGGLAMKAWSSTKKHSPVIFTVTGIAAGLGCVVTACVATTKLNTIVEETKDDLEKIHNRKENADEESSDESVDLLKKDTTKTYAKAGWNIIKLYSIPISLGALSIFSILASHKILKERNAAVTAAYVALDKGYKQYKARVINAIGAEAERRVRYGLKTEEIEEEIIDENGKKKKVKKTIEVPDTDNPSVVVTNDGVYTINGDTMPSPYARYFDASSVYWDKDPAVNLALVRETEDSLNKILKYRGQIFLNEVYRKLGFLETRAGQAVGWIYDPEKEGEKQIDFGVYNIYKPDNRDFVNGYTNVILLDFNVKAIMDELWPDEKDEGYYGTQHKSPMTC